jgi:hypothetical protein
VRFTDGSRQSKSKNQYTKREPVAERGGTSTHLANCTFIFALADRHDAGWHGVSEYLHHESLSKVRR